MNKLPFAYTKKRGFDYTANTSYKKKSERCLEEAVRAGKIIAALPPLDGGATDTIILSLVLRSSGLRAHK